MSNKCHGDCQDVGMPVGNRRKPNLMFKCPNAFIFNISNTCMHMHTSFPCDTCGFKTPGNPEIGPHHVGMCSSRVALQVVGCWCGFPKGRSIWKYSRTNFPAIKGFSQNEAFPQTDGSFSKLPSSTKRKRNPGDKPTPRGRTLGTEHCEYA